MLLFGFLLVAAAVASVLYDKNVKIGERIAEYTALAALLVCFKGGLVSERRTPAELFCAFSKREEARSLAWLGEIFGENSVSDNTEKTPSEIGNTRERVTSFMRDKGILTAESGLCHEDKERLASLFADFGKHTAAEELKRLDGEIEYFTKRAAAVREEGEKNIKARRLLFVTAAAGAFIILL